MLVPSRGDGPRHPQPPEIVDPEALGRSPLWGGRDHLLEEELLPAMAGFFERLEAIDRAIEADQELEVAAHPAAATAGLR